MYEDLLKKIAPVIYHEVYQDKKLKKEKGIPMGYQDLFHRINYWCDLDDADFSIVNGNWQNLRETGIHEILKPEIYYYVTETNTHYFVTFTLYFATDCSPRAYSLSLWKSLHWL